MEGSAVRPSVRFTLMSIGDGDVAVVYRVARGAVKRVPGHVVAIAQITSGTWMDRHLGTYVNWNVQLLPPEDWILSAADMQASGLWPNKVPFTNNNQATSPVELDAGRWAWLEQRLPPAGVKWLSDFALPGSGAAGDPLSP